MTSSWRHMKKSQMILLPLKRILKYMCILACEREECILEESFPCMQWIILSKQSIVWNLETELEDAEAKVLLV